MELAPEDADLVRSVWESYKKFSASELRRMTHAEGPWREARAGIPDHQRSGNEISPESMRRYFRELYDRQAPPGLSVADFQEAEEARRQGKGRSLGQVMAGASG